MRRPNAEHESVPFRVHSLAPDFELIDVWRYPVEADASVPLEGFLRFVVKTQSDLITGNNPAAWLFKLRMLLGRWFGWDEDGAGERIVPSEKDSLRRRLSPEETAALQGFAATLPENATGFRPVFISEDEYLTEIRNRTVHALMHVGRVDSPHASGGWSPQMAIYVKPQGWLGRAYMKLISPFRHYIVYPAMMRAAARGWPSYAASRAWELPGSPRD